MIEYNDELDIDSIKIVPILKEIQTCGMDEIIVLDVAVMRRMEELESIDDKYKREDVDDPEILIKGLKVIIKNATEELEKLERDNK